MIRVKVELDRFGLGQEIIPLARVNIINDGSGSKLRGNYIAQSMRKGSFYGKPQREGRVDNHPRETAHVLTLLRKSLQAMGY